MGTIVKLKFLFSVVLLLWLAGGSCVEKEQGQEDFLAWKRIEQKPQVIDRSKKNIHLQQIVFLNEVSQPKARRCWKNMNMT